MRDTTKRTPSIDTAPAREKLTLSAPQPQRASSIDTAPAREKLALSAPSPQRAPSINTPPALEKLALGAPSLSLAAQRQRLWMYERMGQISAAQLRASDDSPPGSRMCVAFVKVRYFGLDALTQVTPITRVLLVIPAGAAAPRFPSYVRSRLVTAQQFRVARCALGNVVFSDLPTEWNKR
jgi:hypothetical protein